MTLRGGGPRLSGMGFAWTALLAPAMAAASGPSSEPRRIGTDPQLFLDDYVVGRVSGLTRTIHPPVRLDRPVLDSKRFGVCTPYASVLYDEQRQRFRIWYDPGTHVAYAESKDGIHWERHRMLSLPCSYCCSVIDDGDREPDPKRRYKMAYWLRSDGKRPRGMCVAFSPDGLDWTPHKDNPVLLTYPTVEEGIKRHHVGDIIDAFWDPHARRYGAALKLPALKSDGYEPAPKAGILYRRLVGMSHTKDFVNWAKPWRVFVPDDKDEGLLEFYGMGGIHRRGRLWIGFVRVLRDDLSCDPGGPKNGIGYTVLATSRDAVTWHRDRKPFIDRNPKPGTWDHAMTWVSTVLPVGDEVFIYYGGYARGHKIEKRRERQLGLARIRKDGYVSLSAGEKGGWLETPPLVFEGGRLVLNVDVRAGGQVHVELQDDRGRAIPGFSLAQCQAIPRGGVAKTVTWAGKSDVSALAGRCVRLRIEMCRADLYALQFQASAR